MPHRVSKFTSQRLGWRLFTTGWHLIGEPGIWTLAKHGKATVQGFSAIIWFCRQGRPCVLSFFYFQEDFSLFRPLNVRSLKYKEQFYGVCRTLFLDHICELPQQSVNDIFIRILLFLKSLRYMYVYYHHLEWHCKNILAKESNYFFSVKERPPFSDAFSVLVWVIPLVMWKSWSPGH